MAMFNPCEARVNIGIGSGLTDKNSHGVLWLEKNDEIKNQNLRVPFMLDHPHRVQNGLNYWTHRRLMHQIKKMGLRITHIELKVNNKVFCYEAVKYREVYAQQETAKPSETTTPVLASI